MSEPQHPQPHDTETNASRPAPAAVPQPTVLPVLDSLTAVGARLAQLRESKGWSIDDVSARLKVSSPKLRALESGDISHLPDNTFALGVVRSYAKMLGADPAPFTQVLRRETGVPAPDLSMPASSGRDLPRGRVSLSLGNSTPRRRSWLWGVAAVIVAVIAIGMWHTNGGDSAAWLARLKATANGAAGSSSGASSSVAQGETAASGATTDENGAPAAAASQPEAQPANTQMAAAEPASQVAMPTPLPTGNAPAPTQAVPAQAAAKQSASAPTALAANAPAASAGAASAAQAAAEPGESIVGVRVSEDSWFSVRGKDGKELYSGLVHAGESKEIHGQAPFKVTVGNKAGLESVSMDGMPVDASKYSSARGNVARFSLP